MFFLAVAGAGLSLAQQPGKDQQAAATAATFARGKKLILKDGTFHVVRSWERQGDRVRYYSTERAAWEELPAELVDFEATEKAAAEAARQIEESEEKSREAEKARLAEEVNVDASIEIAPGVFLPQGEGMWVIQDKLALPLAPVGTDKKLDKKRLLTQIITPIPVVPGRHKVFIEGKQAVLRLSHRNPEFYFRAADKHEPEIELLQVKVRGNRREVEVISTNIAGLQSSKRRSISLERWEVALGVFRFTLAEALQPGEYALAEYLPGEGLNVYVWDFAVDPTPAPATKKQR